MSFSVNGGSEGTVRGLDLGMVGLKVLLILQNGEKKVKGGAGGGWGLHSDDQVGFGVIFLVLRVCKPLTHWWLEVKESLNFYCECI